MPSADAVLFVDDDNALLRGLSSAIKRRLTEVSILTADNTDDALKLARQKNASVAVIDLEIDPTVGPESGLSLLTSLIEVSSEIRTIVLTGHSDSTWGIEALRRGAGSFVTKPASYDHIYYLIKDALQQSRLAQQLSQTLKSEPLNLYRKRLGLLSASPTMEACLDSAAFSASTRQPLLILGATGCGKSLLARAIHSASDNPATPFIHYQPNFGSPDLVSSELFGHERGAFTGALEKRRGLIEEADGGTLFLDEVDELPLETQIRVLHVLQEKVFRPLGGKKELHSDFRLIAASNRNIEESLASGKLREDFFHRIAHDTIVIPALTERREDIPLLVRNILAEIAERENRRVLRLENSALGKLTSYNWPGNIRELHAVLTNAAARAYYLGSEIINSSHVQLKTPIKPKPQPTGGSLRERMQNAEKQAIAEALKHARGNQSEAARLLQIQRTSLRRLAVRYNLLS
ncbi:MAG: sigma-54 dependent transcriptional regulator [bacterium]|nr:sigma-54 dependent transcriptional regulator [bacterium]